MLQSARKRGAGLRQSGFARRAFQRHSFARAHQIHGGQSQHQRDGGENFEIDDGFDSDAAHGLDAAGAGDAVDQSAEDQRRDDGFDQAQKHVGQRGHPVRFADVRKSRAQRRRPAAWR